MAINILLSLILLVVVFFTYYFLFNDKIKKEKYTKISELVLLTNKFNLDKKKMNYKECLTGVAIINAIIIAVTCFIFLVIDTDKLYWFPIAFILIIILIVGFYYCYGKYLQRKWGKGDK